MAARCRVCSPGGQAGHGVPVIRPGMAVMSSRIACVPNDLVAKLSLVWCILEHRSSRKWPNSHRQSTADVHGSFGQVLLASGSRTGGPNGREFPSACPHEIDSA